VPKLDQPLLFTPAPLPTAELSADERLACLRLIRSENVGPVTFRELVNRFGGAAHALQALPDLSRRGGSGRAIRLCPKADAEKELEAAERAGAVPVFTIGPDYPALLARIEAPPPMVYVKGRRELLNRPAIAIVGSRQCSAAGVQVTRQFANELAEAGFVIVSGLARGIDRAAHEAALTRGTVAVLAGGDWIYPPEHAELQRRIGSEGCFVTERPPGFQPREKNFPRRNRIIAGLVHGVVIIEAAMRSGTLITARFANDLGREVFALPGHPLDPRAEGTNRLIKSGATFVTAPEDVVAVLRPIIGLDEPLADYGLPVDTASNQRNCEPPSGNIAPGDLMNAVLTALGPAPMTIDAIARATGLTVQDVQIAILELDLAGRIERQGHSLVALKGG
jgi:DNA processing protein